MYYSTGSIIEKIKQTKETISVHSNRYETNSWLSPNVYFLYKRAAKFLYDRAGIVCSVVICLSNQPYQLDLFIYIKGLNVNLNHNFLVNL